MPTSTARNSALCAANHAPSTRKLKALSGAAASMNCGRKARKNSATFGLSTFVSRPWRKVRPSGGASSAAPGDTAAAGARAGSAHAARSMPAASQTR